MKKITVLLISVLLSGGCAGLKQISSAPKSFFEPNPTQYFLSCLDELQGLEPEAFADALCFLADNPTIREQMGIQARKLAEEKFDRKKLATMFVDFLEQTKAASSNGWPHGR